MTNQEIAQTMKLIGDLLEIKGESVYKTAAYRKASETLETSSEDVNQLWKENRLKDLPGIGEAISAKIAELLETGHLQFLENLEAEIPPDIISLLAVPGIGPKTALQLYKNLGIKGIAELEEAAKDGRIATVPGMGQKKAESLLQNIEAVRGQQQNNQILLGVALPCARQLMTEITAQDPYVKQATITGAIRRGEEAVDEISILVASDDTYETLEAFLKRPDIAQVIKKRDYKADVIMKNGLKVEFITCFPEQLATALAWTTATREHRSQIRDLAWKRGYELTMGGFIKQDEIWPAVDEEEVYRYLGLPYIPPELRKGNGEIEAVSKGEMALDLVRLTDIKGDLHAHSIWSDGVHSVEQMARAAAQKGYRYLLMTDHTKSLGIVRGLTEERLKEQQAEIYRINDLLANEGFDFRLLSGAEVEIKADGELDFEDEILAQMDIVVASLHSSLRQDRRKITERLMKAMSNPHVDIIAHPTGRIINSRPAAQLNMLKIFVHARETGTALEINSGPDRLDLKAEHVQQALEEKAKLVISSDAHATRALDTIEYGVITARRGGARANEILNTLELGSLRASLK